MTVTKSERVVINRAIVSPIITVPVAAVVGIVAYIVTHDFALVEFLPITVVLNALVGLGFVRTRADIADETVLVRESYRPSWLGLLATCITAFLGLSNLWSSFSTPPKLLPTLLVWLAAGAPSVWWMTRRLRSGKPSGSLTNFTQHTLFSAGLTVKSAATGQTRYPAIISEGHNDLGNPWVVVGLIPGAQTVGDFAKKADRLASAWGAPRVAVEEVNSRTVKLTAVVNEFERDGSVNWQGIADAAHHPVAQYLGRLPMGEYADNATPWYQSAAESNFTIGGVPGAGKSVYLNALLAHMVAHPHIDVAFVDLKGGVEAEPWRSRLSAVATKREQAVALLQDTLADMEARYEDMRQNKVRNAWKTGYLGDRNHVKVVVIDEAAELFTGAMTKDERAEVEAAMSITRSLVSRGRAAGYVVLLATQKPTTDTLPSAIRDLTNTRVAFKCTTYPQAAAVLGGEWTEDAVSPMSVTKEQKGRAVVADDAGTFIMVQCAYISDEQVDAAVAAPQHPVGRWLDRVSATAPGQVPLTQEVSEDPFAHL